MQKLILALALAGAIVSLPLASGKAVWKAASTIDAASYVARERQEDILMYRPEEMAGVLLITFLEDFKVIANVLATRLILAPGGITATTLTTSSLQSISDSMLPKSRSEYVRRLDADWQRPAIQLLAKENIRFDSIEEIRLVSKEFNVLGRRAASSTHVVHVIDAASLLGRRGTVVILYRLDREMRWGWSNAHDLFSFGRHEVQTRLIDLSLFNTVARLGVAEPKTAFVGSFGQKQLYEYVDEWRHVRDSLLRIPAKDR